MSKAVAQNRYTYYLNPPCHPLLDRRLGFVHEAQFCRIVSTKEQ
jgi:hypothetical protein